MKSRERVLKALDHEEPDRVPIDFGGFCTQINAEAYKRLREHLGLTGEPVIYLDRIANTVRPERGVLERFNVDIYTIFSKPAKEIVIEEKEDGYYTRDEWGFVYKRPKPGYWFDKLNHPLASAEVSDLDNYHWPDPVDPKRLRGLDAEAEEAFEDGYAVALAPPAGGVLELSMWLRGSQKFLLDLAVNKRFAKALMDKICEWYIKFFDAALDVVKDCVQIVNTADDLGTQTGPMIGPRLYREMVKPFHTKLNGAIKKKGDFYINFHSCGSVRKLLPDIIETGVDAINPVQVSAKDMDTKKLKEEFGDKITFWGGGCDSQRVLPYGNPEDVENEVKRRISDLAAGGGYIFAPIHNIQYEVPPENIVAMFEAANKYGPRYTAD